MKPDDLHPFVAREQELERLGEHLDLALRGQGRICFVAGEAGAGKTALLAEFARRAQEVSQDLVVGIGECNAQTGVGDPYLPFREMLRLLTGDAEADRTHPVATEENATRLERFLRASSEALVESGPDLVGIFIPGGSLLTRLGAKLVGKTPAAARLQSLVSQKPQDGSAPGVETLQQSQVFEQYTNVLRGMAASFPLLLVLDDLHWADEASLGLLFHLGRRIEDSRILVVGSYRASDTKAGRRGERHPLIPVLNELQRHFGDVPMELGAGDQARQRDLVDALVDAQPNALDRAFRDALLKRTEGHPLFVVELLHHLQGTGGLLRNGEGLWVTGPDLRWDALPARVEGIVGERVQRLPDELRDLLATASVEGEQFTAEVVARVRGLDERAVVRQLSGELEKQHDLVSAVGVQRVGERRVSTYRFRHNLFHEYLYGTLDPVERSYLHEDVGLALEAVYGDHAHEIAVQLARHFDEAGDGPRALPYRLQAGHRAQQQYAHAEAILHFRRVLELLATSGAGQIREEEARDMGQAAREGLGDTLALTGRMDEARAAFSEVLAGLEPNDRLGAARLRRKTGDAWLAQHSAEEALKAYEEASARLEDEAGLPGPPHTPEWLQIQLQRMWGLYFQGSGLEESAARVRPLLEEHGTEVQKARFFQYLAMGRLRASRYLVSDEIMALALAGEEASRASGHLGAMATSHYLLGACHLDRLDGSAAEERLQESLRLARRTGAATLILPALAWLAVAFRFQGRVEEARATASATLEMSREMGNSTYLAIASLNLAWVAWREGRLGEAKEMAQGALDQTVPHFPFRWLGEWPLLGAALREGRLADAMEHARRMLEPTQQHLPDSLAELMAEAVRHWDDGDPSAAGAGLEALVPVAAAAGRL
jgi:tetratricopeptide (TPR) repeat protein